MTSTCKNCQQEITWTKRKDEAGNDRNVPLNPDGSRHICMGKSQGQEKKPDERIRVRITSYTKLLLNYTELEGRKRVMGIGLTPAAVDFLEQHGIKDKLPIECEITGTPTGMIAGIWIPGINAPDGTLRPASDLHLQQNLEQIKKEQPGGTTKPAEPEKVAPPPGAPLEGKTEEPGSDGSLPTSEPFEIPPDMVFEVTVCGNVNLQNFESLKISVTGAVGYGAEKILYAELDHILSQLGRTHPVTMEAIDSYRKRVLGGAI